MTTERSLEELQADAAAAQRAVELAQAVRRQAEREARERADAERVAAAKEARRVRVDTLLQPISARLTAAGIDNVVTPHGITLQPRDYQNDIALRDRNDKWQITFGIRGDKERFPLRREGTFNAAAIVAKIVERRTRQAQIERIERERTEARTAADAFAAEVSARIGRPVAGYYGTTTASPGKVILPLFPLELTPDEAKIMADALRSIGR